MSADIIYGITLVACACYGGWFGYSGFLCTKKEAMRQPVWLYAGEKITVITPYLSLFGRLMPPMAMGWPD